MQKENEAFTPHELAVRFVVEAPDIQLRFRMYPEVAASRKVRVEGYDRVRALKLVNGAWAILGVLESEVPEGEQPKVFFTVCESGLMKDAGMLVVFDHLMKGTMGEFLALNAEVLNG